MYFVDYLPVTTGNDLRLYVDGQDYGADLYTDLLGARRYVFLTGLHFMADYRLLRTGTGNDQRSAVGAVLATLAQRGVAVYLLVNQFWKDEQEVRWLTSPVRRKIMKDGELVGYLPETYKLFQMLSAYPSAYCRTDIHAHSDVFGTHHQKTVVIDGRVAHLGGIDLTYLDGDRWDTPAHSTPAGRPPLRATDRTQKYWHDVQLRVTGPAVQLVRDNFVQRWTWGHLHHVVRRDGVLLGVRDLAPPPLPDLRAETPVVLTVPTGREDGSTPLVQIVRSMPRPTPVLAKELGDKRVMTAQRRRDATYARQKPSWNRSNADWERSAKDAYLTGIRAARKYVYLENQWVADEHIWAELAAVARRNALDPGFRIIVMVPYEGLFAAGLGSNQELRIDAEIRKVREALKDPHAFGVYALSPTRDGQGQVTGQIYVHSKVMIVDDVWALIGSANAGGISLEGIRSARDRPDTELSAVVLDPAFASRFRQRLWSEHLGVPVHATYDPREADLFRVHAELPGRRVTYDPRYTYVSAFGPPAPRPSAQPYRKLSRLVPSFPDRYGVGVPPTLLRAAFTAQLVPAPPAGLRLWYRWAVEVPFARDNLGRESVRGTRFHLRSLPDDEDDVWTWSTHAAAYVGAATAQKISSRTSDVIHGRVLCRVAFTPLGRTPSEESAALLLEHELDFMNADFARANHPDLAR